jgi:miniconductance mechanosensitive channel
VFWETCWYLHCAIGFMDYSYHFNALRDYLKLKPRYSDKPSFIQVIMIVLWAVGITVIFRSCLISIKRTFDYSGAVSAVIILIFRDTILGFVERTGVHK